MAKKPRFLFVCQNSATFCQMAEGMTRYLAGTSVDVESAGPIGSPIHPYCHWAMNEAGIDITDYSIDPLAGKDLSTFTHIVTFGMDSREACKSAPPGIRVEHWELPDPGKVRGRPSDLILAFRSVRNEIEKRIRKLLGSALKK